MTPSASQSLCFSRCVMKDLGSWQAQTLHGDPEDCQSPICIFVFSAPTAYATTNYNKKWKADTIVFRKRTVNSLTAVCEKKKHCHNYYPTEKLETWKKTGVVCFVFIFFLLGAKSADTLRTMLSTESTVYTIRKLKKCTLWCTLPWTMVVRVFLHLRNHCRWRVDN